MSGLDFYNRTVRVAKLYDEIKANRVTYFLSELATQAQSLYPRKKSSPEVQTREIISALTNNPESAKTYQQALIDLLLLLEHPSYHRNKNVKNDYIPEPPTLARIMTLLWQALEDAERGYPIEIPLAIAAQWIAYKILQDTGELSIWPENLKNTPENK